MAKKYSKPLRTRVKDAFGRINKVTVKGEDGSVLREIASDNDFTNFYNNPTHRNNANKYTYEVEPKNTSNLNNVKSSTSGFKKITESYTKKKNIKVSPGGSAKEKFGEEGYKPKTSTSKFLQGLDNHKMQIVDDTPNSRLVEIAKRKDASRYFDIIDDSGLNEYNTDAEKADAIRDFVRKRNMTRSKNSKVDLYASGVVWDAGKDSKYVNPLKRDYGKVAYNNVDNTLKKNKSTQRDALKIMKKRVRNKYGNKGSTERKIFDNIKHEMNFQTDVDTMKFLEKDDGKRVFEEKLAEKVGNNNIKKSKANSIAQKYNLRKINTDEIQVNKKLSTSKQRKLVGQSILGYSGTTAGNKASRFLHDKLKKDPEALRAMESGDENALWNHKPKSVSFNEIHAYYGGTPTKKHLKKMKEHGIDITGAPPDIEDYLSGTKEKTSSSRGRGRPRKSSSGSSSSSYSSGRGRSSYSKGGSLLGEEEISWIGGKPHIRKKRGKIGSWIHNAGGSIKSKIKPKKRDYNKTYNKLRDREDLKYLTDEELKYAARTNPATRSNIVRKGRKMFFNKGYRAKQRAKEEERKGRYEAKLMAAQKQSKRRMKAASSPWWRVWYTLTHNIWVMIGLFLVISLLFLPIGLFHVLGWAIAVGMVSLVLFVIWAFIEFWWLIAQGITAMINLLGQLIVNLVNFVGQAVTNPLGMEFTPFEHTMVRNMAIADIDPDTGERVILGIKWGEFNLIPPDFLKLNSFMPEEFDTDVLIAKIWPSISGFFNWYTQPIADRYTEWIESAPWYTVGAMIGIPVVLIIIGIVLAVYYVRRKMI